jgi:hypothetical protein
LSYLVSSSLYIFWNYMTKCREFMKVKNYLFIYKYTWLVPKKRDFREPILHKFPFANLWCFKKNPIYASHLYPLEPMSPFCGCKSDKKYLQLLIHNKLDFDEQIKISNLCLKCLLSKLYLPNWTIYYSNICYKHNVLGFDSSTIKSFLATILYLESCFLGSHFCTQDS